MPVTTRQQARLRALEALEASLRSTRSSAPSPAPASAAHPQPPPSLRRAVSPWFNIHGRRCVGYSRRHIRADITTAGSVDFPSVPRIYVPGPEQFGREDEEELEASNDYAERYGLTGYGLGDGPSNPGPSGAGPRDSIINSEDGDKVNAHPAEKRENDELSDLPDYESEMDYEYPSPPGVDTTMTNTTPEPCGTKRKRSPTTPEPMDVDTFLASPPLGTNPTTREVIDPALRSSSLDRKMKRIRLESPELPSPLQKHIARLEAVLLISPVLGREFVPTLVPLLELPCVETKYYELTLTAPDYYRNRSPAWVPEWGIHHTWQRSLSPKISPTDTREGGTPFALVRQRERRRLEEIREKMKIGRLLNGELVERSVVCEPKLFDPRWRNGMNRAQMQGVFARVE